MYPITDPVWAPSFGVVSATFLELPVLDPVQVPDFGHDLIAQFWTEARVPF